MRDMRTRDRIAVSLSRTQFAVGLVAAVALPNAYPEFILGLMAGGLAAGSAMVPVKTSDLSNRAARLLAYSIPAFMTMVGIGFGIRYQHWFFWVLLAGLVVAFVVGEILLEREVVWRLGQGLFFFGLFCGYGRSSTDPRKSREPRAARTYWRVAGSSLLSATMKQNAQS